MIACQLIGVLCVVSWTVGNMGTFFLIFKYFGKLRIKHEDEILGLDLSRHGGTAYPMDPYHKTYEQSRSLKANPVFVTDLALPESVKMPTFGDSPEVPQDFQVCVESKLIEW